MTNKAQENATTIAEHIINDCETKHLDGMSANLITAAVKFIGDSPTDNLAIYGDEGFEAVVANVHKNSSLSNVASLNVDDVVTAFYAEHKDDILEYCAESACQIGENSALEAVAALMRANEYNLTLDQVAIALFVPTVGEPCEITVNVQRFAIAYVLDSVAEAHQVTNYYATEAQ